MVHVWEKGWAEQTVSFCYVQCVWCVQCVLYCAVLYCVLVPSFSSRLSQQEPVLPAPDIYISTDAGGGQGGHLSTGHRPHTLARGEGIICD